MKNFVKVIIIALFCAALLIGAYFLYSSLANNYSPPAETQHNEQSGNTASAPSAPDFTVYDGSDNKVKLSDYKGKPIVINFWASWCPPCKGELPSFQKMYEKYASRVQFMMVNLSTPSNDPRESADRLISNGGYTFPVFYDRLGSAASVYNTASIPVTYFISADGSIVNYVFGEQSVTSLEYYLETLLG